MYAAKYRASRAQVVEKAIWQMVFRVADGSDVTEELEAMVARFETDPLFGDTESGSVAFFFCYGRSMVETLCQLLPKQLMRSELREIKNGILQLLLVIQWMTLHGTSKTYNWWKTMM